MRIPLVLAFALVAQAGRDQSKPGAPAKSAAAEPFRVETTLDAMGGPFSIIAYGEDAHKLSAAANAAAEEVRRLDRLMSNYQPDSEWSLLNRDAARGPVRVSRETLDLIRACLEYNRASGGTFDIAVGPLMKVWGFYKGGGRLPHRSEVRVALAKTGSSKIRIDEAAGTIQFAAEGVEIDPGGIGKGVAIDSAAAILQSYGVRSALISAARSSIAAIGAPPNAAGWKVQIRHPLDSSQSIQEVVLNGETMSTSGNYEKFFRAEGKLYSHIMDPRTGYPAEGMLSVSVIAPRGIDSEAWTKPVYIHGRAWAQSHLPKGFRAYLCEDQASGKQSAVRSAVRGPFQAAGGEKNLCAWLQ